MVMNLKAVLFWSALFGAAVCFTFAFGAAAGIGAFAALAFAILLLA